MWTDCLRCRRVKGMEASRASQVETARGSGAARTTEKTISNLTQQLLWISYHLNKIRQYTYAFAWNT